MSRTIELILLNRPAELARLQDQLEMLGREFGLPPKILHEVQLAVEELLTNIFKHAFTDQREHEISVCLIPGEIDFCVVVEDDGRPFNPLEHPEPDVSLPLDQRPLGGLGIHMIRNSMDRIEYCRVNGKNRLMMTKLIKAPAP